eukprot:symbB.v1.2.021182.t2/scaffold1779.1/size154953/10
MNVVGLVSIPGMMTGQILGGAPPMKAANYQIVITFMISGGSFAALVLICAFTIQAFFDASGRHDDSEVKPQPRLNISKLLDLKRLMSKSSKVKVEQVTAAATPLLADSASPLVLQRSWQKATGEGPALLDITLDGLVARRQPLKVDLKVRGGEVLCFMGPSGIGKSTILKWISDLTSSQSWRLTITDTADRGICRGIHMFISGRQYLNLRTMLRRFGEHDKFMPVTLHRNLLKVGLEEPLLHLQRCRPLGLLLLLLKLRYRVHRDADEAVKMQLEQWIWCKHGWHDWCNVVDDRHMTLTLPPRPPGADSGNVSLNMSSQPPWDGFSKYLGKVDFLAIEKGIFQTIWFHLNISNSSQLPLPLASTLTHCSNCRLLGSERKVYSQYGLDGVLEAVFKCIGVTTKSFVEIGTQDGTQCSTRYLRTAHGFVGYMFDDGNEDERIGLQKGFLEPSFAASLINATLRNGAGIRVPKMTPFQLDLLAIDTDGILAGWNQKGMDYELWRSMCASIRPRVLVLEEWNVERLRLYRLAKRCGYLLVHKVLQDMVFLRKDVLPAACQPPHVGDVDFWQKRERFRALLAEIVASELPHEQQDLVYGGFNFESMGVSVEALERILSLRGQEVGPQKWRREVLYLHQIKAPLPGTPSSFIEAVERLHANAGRPPLNVAPLLQSIGLEEHMLQRSWSELSGGENQRMMLAIALATTPACLVLDEPTSALDEASKLLVEDVLKKRGTDSCIIMATHDAQQAERVASSLWTFSASV